MAAENDKTPGVYVISKLLTSFFLSMPEPEPEPKPKRVFVILVAIFYTTLKMFMFNL